MGLEWKTSRMPFFNQSIVDLQYCVSLRHTAKWFSYTYIYSFHYGILEAIEYSSLCYTAGLCCWWWVFCCATWHMGSQFPDQGWKLQAAALEAQSPKHQTGREVPRMPSNVTILVCLYLLGLRLRLVHHALAPSPPCQIPEVLAGQSEYDQWVSLAFP